MNILPIGDTHTHPGDNSKRLQALGNYIVDKKPDVIVIMGDWFDFDSISKFNEPGSITREGMRLRKELDVGAMGYKIMLHELSYYNKQQAKHKHKQYLPEVIFLKGNHEFRLDKLAENNAIFSGAFSIEKELNQVYPTTMVEYGEYIDIDGILFTHIPFKAGRPLASVVNTTGATLDLVDKSVIFGHTHRLEVKEKRRAGSYNLIRAINVGCLFENIPNYAKNDNPAWWKGLVPITSYGKGEFDFSTLSMTQLKKQYA